MLVVEDVVLQLLNLAVAVPLRGLRCRLRASLLNRSKCPSCGFSQAMFQQMGARAPDIFPMMQLGIWNIPLN
jgi:hypothetical protein